MKAKKMLPTIWRAPLPLKVAAPKVPEASA